MAISTISGTVTSTVTLGGTAYAATLLITNAGVIDTGSTASPLADTGASFTTYAVTNDGLIEGDLSATGGDFLLQNNGTIAGQAEQFYSASLENEGLINAAVGLRYSALDNGGSIAAQQTAVSFNYGGFFNSGLIKGGDVGAAINEFLFGLFTATNTGTIAGGSIGVAALDATVANQGVISGGQGGFTGNVLLNSGLVSGGAYGAYLHSTSAYASFALSNSGTIAGGAAGVTINGDGVILDSGTISGASYAILDPGHTLALTLAPGAALYGQVTVGAGIAVLEGTLPGINIANLAGFNQIEYITSGAITGLINNGSFSQNDPAGLSLEVGGTVQNSGMITAPGTFHNQYGLYYKRIAHYGGTGIIAGGVVSLTNTGLISGLETGISLAAGGIIVNAGIIAATGSYYAYGYFGPNRPDGTTISHGPATAIYNAAGALALTVAPGAVFYGAVTDSPGTGALTLAASSVAGTLDIASFSGFENIDFATDSAWTLEGTTLQLAGGEVIAGLTLGDTILLDNFTATDTRYYPGLGLVLSNGSAFPMLHFTDGATAFDVTSAGGSTTITAACFCRGTRITTPGGEVPVEDLRIGDAVLTLHAGEQKIKWLGRRAYAAPFAGGDFIRPIRIRPGALDDDIPKRALNLSPGHALFAGGALVPAWRLLNGASVTQAAHVELVEYYHIELDAQEVIFAEGCPVESFFDASLRGQFCNADEFLRLYPDAEDQAPCLTLLEDGFALEGLKARVNARAGLPPAPLSPTGPLRGFVDVAGPATVEGWAQDEGTPEAPVTLDILRAGQRVGRVLANRYRADLRAAGLGSGCHAFRFTLPAGEGKILVLRAADSAILPLTDEAARVA